MIIHKDLLIAIQFNFFNICVYSFAIMNNLNLKVNLWNYEATFRNNSDCTEALHSLKSPNIFYYFCDNQKMLSIKEKV